MYEFLMVILLLVGLALIGLILVQHGKGADMGSSFGAGASATLFGSAGSGNFLTHATAILGMTFFVLCLILGNMTTNQPHSNQGWRDVIPENQKEKEIKPESNKSIEPTKQPQRPADVDVPQ